MNKQKLIRFFRWAFLSTISGLLSGLAAAIFLILLNWATQTRDTHPVIIWALPFAGFFIGWAYHHFGKDAAAGSNLILEEIHDPKKVVPYTMAPFILCGTVITHLFGGSAGREGTAVQMGASLSDQLSHFFKIEPSERKILLVSGAGAGFGAAIGAPWAGVIFGMEVINIGGLKLFALVECFIASFVAYYTALLLHAPHSIYPNFEIPNFTFNSIFFIALAAVIFGLTSRLFVFVTHIIEKFFNRHIAYPPLKPAIAGMALVILYYLEGSYRYVGLGIPFIQDAINHMGTFRDPILKIFFTGLTVGTGFKGGEFIPLVFIGTTLGSALGVILPVSFQLLAACGFAAVFAGASNAPIACSLMAIEIFGLKIAPYAIVACLVSYFFSGHLGVYKSQKVLVKKHQKLLSVLRTFRKERD